MPWRLMLRHTIHKNATDTEHLLYVTAMDKGNTFQPQSRLLPWNFLPLLIAAMWKLGINQVLMYIYSRYVRVVREDKNRYKNRYKTRTGYFIHKVPCQSPRLKNPVFARCLLCSLALRLSVSFTNSTQQWTSAVLYSIAVVSPVGSSTLLHFHSLQAVQYVSCKRDFPMPTGDIRCRLRMVWTVLFRIALWVPCAWPTRRRLDKGRNLKRNPCHAKFFDWQQDVFDLLQLLAQVEWISLTIHPPCPVLMR